MDRDVVIALLHIAAKELMLEEIDVDEFTGEGGFDIGTGSININIKVSIEEVA